MRKRILIDLLNLSTPEIAGVGVFTRNLFSAWLNKGDLPYAITCYAISAIQPQDLFGFSERSSVHIKKVNIKRLLSRLSYQQLILPFHLRKYDLYFNPAVGIPFLARIISPHTKLVVTIHDMTPFYFPKKYTFIRSILVRLLSKYAAKAAHQVVTVSQNSKNDLMRIASVKSSKIAIVYNFLSPPYALSNANDNRYFLCISTLEPGKNIENTVRAFAQFKQEKNFHAYQFYWIGRIGWGIREQDLKDFIKDQHVDDSFHLIGYVTESEKKKWLENCTAIVYLSHYEGFGLPVLEGLTYNKPSIASNVSSLPEVVGETGILCDPLDPVAVATALKMMVLHTDGFKAKIPEQVRRFDPTEQTRVFEQLILSLLN